MSTAIDMTDSFLTVGEPAFHGLGTLIPRDVGLSVSEGVAKALPWDVEAKPLYAFPDADAMGPGSRYVMPGQAIFRVPHNGGQPVPLSCVGPDFALFTNRELGSLAELAETVSGGEARLETIGSIAGGKKVFIMLRTGSYGVGLGGGDETFTYLALLNGHDGSRRICCFPTHVRIFCGNAEARAYASAQYGSAITHRGDISGAVEEIREAIRKGVFSSLSIRLEDESLAAHSVGLAKDVGAYFAGVYESAIGPIVAPDSTMTLEEQVTAQRGTKRAKATVIRWVEEFEHSRQELVAGTMYAALQAVTYWADHSRTKVRDSAGDRLIGRGAQIKRIAREKALDFQGA